MSNNPDLVLARLIKSLVNKSILASSRVNSLVDLSGLALAISL
jgi:hypothetical protein